MWVNVILFFAYVNTQIYETNLGKFSMPESKSPVLLDYLNLLWLVRVIKVTNFSRLEVLGGHSID